MRVAIIGNGNVGSALERGLERSGHEVRTVGHEPDRVQDAARSAEAIFLAVPFGAIDDVIVEFGDAADGKVLVDVTNVIDQDSGLAIGFDTSGAEELQRKAPSSRVVKAFNTVFAEHMDDGHVDGEQLSAMIAADDPDAKAAVMELARSIGFDAVDAGPLRNARLLEPMGFQNIQLGYALGMGTGIGFRLVH